MSSSTGFFLTKKQKKLLKERRRKKKRFAGNTDNVVTPEHEETTTAAEDDAGGGTGGDPPKSSNDAKATHHEESSIKPGKRKRDDYIIYIPDEIYDDTKAAKKFRKDSRRQARGNGLDETKLEFRKESQRKTPSRKFPNLKQLVEVQKHNQKDEQEPSTTANGSTTTSLPITVDTSRYVALDCEMVGIGKDGKRSVLARASLVDWDGHCLFDEYVKVPVQVTDYRTQFSGIRPKHLKGNNAISPTECRNKIAELIRGKILVGHAVHNDLTVLMLQHQEVRDTGKYRPFQRYSGKWRPRKLRDLVKEHLGKTIQTGSHDSVQDAACTMELFKTVHREWEHELRLQEEQKNRKRKK